MHGPMLVLLAVGMLWLLAASVVVVYPLVAGRMRAGAETVYRASDPQHFWSTYAFSTLLFLGVSVAAAVFVRSLMR